MSTLLAVGVSVDGQEITVYKCRKQRSTVNCPPVKIRGKKVVVKRHP